MKNTPNEIVATLYLENCWVCGVPRGSKNFEEHHVVPRSYGGEKGPTVSLCCDCHTNAHKSSEKLYVGSSPFLPYENKVSLERCLYLATVICNSRIAIEKFSPENKRYVYSGSFDAKTHEKLVRLSKHLKMPQKKLLKFAIEDLYRKMFR